MVATDSNSERPSAEAVSAEHPTNASTSILACVIAGRLPALDPYAPGAFSSYEALSTVGRRNDVSDAVERIE